jgi:hypothetical protein
MRRQASDDSIGYKPQLFSSRTPTSQSINPQTEEHKMKNTIIVSAIMIAVSVLLTPALAKPVQCFLSVNGKVYIDKICDYDEFDKDGSFTIGANGKSRYFPYVFPGSESYWNEAPTSTHAHTSLGVLHQSGACWTNEQARVCAWKIGEKR